MNIYGYSSVIDVNGCNPDTFNREQISGFLIDLCDQIGMEREDLHWWDFDDDPEAKDAAPAHLKGTSAVQFIKTSSIVLHTLDDMSGIFIDLFSCKRYDPMVVQKVIVAWFGGTIRSCQTFARYL